LHHTTPPTSIPTRLSSDLVSHDTFIFKAAANVFGQTFFRYKIAADVLVNGVIEHVVSAWATVFMVLAAPTQKLYAIDGTSNDHEDRKSTRLNSSHLGISYA